jgi:hypothetical protein
VTKHRQYRAAKEKTKYTSSMSKAKRDKHWPRKAANRLAKFDEFLAAAAVQHEIELRPVLAKIVSAIPDDWKGPRPITMTGLGGGMPVQGHGETDTNEQWYFRFRSDCVGLRIYSDELLKPRLDVACAELTGNPYAGDLDRDEAVALISALWPMLSPPTKEYVPAGELRALLNESTITHHP